MPYAPQGITGLDDDDGGDDSSKRPQKSIS
jgi:hypothetical protein